MFSITIPTAFSSLRFLLLLSPFLAAAASALDVAPRAFIQLSGQDRLPAAFVASWPTFVLEQDSLIKIPDTNGFVEPTSIDELWHPVDSMFPSATLAVGLHVRHGVIRHIMPALDLSFDGLHRNRGLCSVPRAHTWVDFSATASSSSSWQQKWQLIASKRKLGDEEWEEVCSTYIGDIESAVLHIARISESIHGDGSQIIHIPLEEPFVGLKTGIEVRVHLMSPEHEEPLAALQVVASPTAAGSESEYLPDAYKPLFEDMSLRRHAYEEIGRASCRERV